MILYGAVAAPREIMYSKVLCTLLICATFSTVSISITYTGFIYSVLIRIKNGCYKYEFPIFRFSVLVYIALYFFLATIAIPKHETKHTCTQYNCATVRWTLTDTGYIWDNVLLALWQTHAVSQFYTILEKKKHHTHTHTPTKHKKKKSKPPRGPNKNMMHSIFSHGIRARIYYINNILLGCDLPHASSLLSTLLGWNFCYVDEIFFFTLRHLATASPIASTL